MVDTMRRVLARLLRTGRISPAAYRLLTGLVLLRLGQVLTSSPGSHDPAARPVGVVLLGLGVVLCVRGAAALVAARR